MDNQAVNAREVFKFVPAGEEDREEVEELTRKQKRVRIQRPKKVSTKLQVAIKKSWKENSTTFAKQKGRKGEEKRGGAHKVQKQERNHEVYAAIEQETAGQSVADGVLENMEIDEDDKVPLSIPMTSDEIRHRVIKNEIKRGKEGKSNQALLQIDDMMEIEEN